MNIERDEIFFPVRVITVSSRINRSHVSIWSFCSWYKKFRACNFEDDVFQGETFDLVHQENVRRLKAESKFIQHLTPSWEHGISIAFDLKLGMGIDDLIWYGPIIYFGYINDMSTRIPDKIKIFRKNQRWSFLFLIRKWAGKTKRIPIQNDR